LNTDNIVYLDKNSLVLKKQELKVDFITSASIVVENAFTMSQSKFINENEREDKNEFTKLELHRSFKISDFGKWNLIKVFS